MAISCAFEPDRRRRRHERLSGTQGTIHVSCDGNVVTLGSALAFGASGALAKTPALPVFCVAVFLARLLPSAGLATARAAATSAAAAIAPDPGRSARRELGSLR
jgi:hypothetical protein